jgi:hypothetical protein
MSAKGDLRAEARNGKRAWRSPRLEEVGNLRDFVQEGIAMGKSGPGADGTTSGNNEAMNP